MIEEVIYKRIKNGEYRELLRLSNGELKPFKWVGRWIAYYDSDGERKIYEPTEKELKEIHEKIRSLPKGSIIIEGGS